MRRKKSLGALLMGLLLGAWVFSADASARSAWDDLEHPIVYIRADRVKAYREKASQPRWNRAIKAGKGPLWDAINVILFRDPKRAESIKQDLLKSVKVFEAKKDLWWKKIRKWHYVGARSHLVDSQWVTRAVFQYDALHGNAVLSGADRRRIEAMFVDFSQRILYTHDVYGDAINNRAIWNFCALYLTAWFDSDRERGAALRTRSIRMLRKNFRGIFPEGVYNELSPGYQSYGAIALGRFLLAYRNLEGVDLFHQPVDGISAEPYFTTYYKQHFTPRFTLAEVEDAGAQYDSPYLHPWTNQTLILSWAEYKDPEIAWILTQLRKRKGDDWRWYRDWSFLVDADFPAALPEGKPLRFDSHLMPTAGRAVLRAGSDPERYRFLQFDYGHWGGGHGHWGRLQVSIEADGEKFTADGKGKYGTRVHEGYYRQSYAHNLICIDRTGQHPVCGKKIASALSPVADIIWAAGQGGEDPFGFGGSWMSSHVEGYPGVVLRRAVVFVRPDYFVIRDTAVCEVERRAELLWHLLGSPELTLEKTSPRVASHEKVIYRAAPKAAYLKGGIWKRYKPGTYAQELDLYAYTGQGATITYRRPKASLALRVVRPASGTLGLGRAPNPNEKNKRNAGFLVIAPAGTGRVHQFLTVLEPFKTEPRILAATSGAAKPGRSEATGGDSLIVSRQGGRDLFLFSNEGPRAGSVEGFRFTGGIGLLRLAGDRVTAAAGVMGVGALAYGNESLLRSAAPLRAVALASWATPDRALVLEADEHAQDLRLTVSRKPARVTLNGKPVRFRYDSRTGGLRLTAASVPEAPLRSAPGRRAPARSERRPSPERLADLPVRRAKSRARGVKMSYERVPLGVRVDKANTGLFNAPIFTHNGAVYVAFVRPAPAGDAGENRKGYQTVVGRHAAGKWEWSVVESNNLRDPYHAQPSLVVDREGYIHVTYNMHSSPWQYKVSRNPEDISAWEFRGQPLKGPHNVGRSSYVRGPGTAAIPGNRVTYQFMTTDREGTPYVAYRECLRCGGDYFRMQWSLGIAKYDLKTKTWRRVGPDGGVRPFATESGFRAQGAHIAFDANNRMHVSWVWYAEYEREGSGHRKPNYPTYAWSDDGGDTFHRADGTPLKLPIDFAQTDVVVAPKWLEPNKKGYFYGYTRVAATRRGNPYVWVMPKDPPPGTGRAIVPYVAGKGWGNPILTPWSATRFVIDGRDVITAVSSGLRVHRSYDGGKTWKMWEIDVKEGSFTCWLDTAYAARTGNLRLLAQRGKTGELRVYTVTFSDAAPLGPSDGRKRDPAGK